MKQAERYTPFHTTFQSDSLKTPSSQVRISVFHPGTQLGKSKTTYQQKNNSQIWHALLEFPILELGPAFPFGQTGHPDLAFPQTSTGKNIVIEKGKENNNKNYWMQD